VDGPLAQVEVGGVSKIASVHLLDDVKPGDYIVMHAGFALSRLDEAEAHETLRLLEQMGELAPGTLG
jgi:hydrogenase expression/formation protein HypC